MVVGDAHADVGRCGGCRGTARAERACKHQPRGRWQSVPHQTLHQDCRTAQDGVENLLRSEPDRIVGRQTGFLLDVASCGARFVVAEIARVERDRRDPAGRDGKRCALVQLDDLAERRQRVAG